MIIAFSYVIYEVCCLACILRNRRSFADRDNVVVINNPNPQYLNLAANYNDPYGAYPQQGYQQQGYQQQGYQQQGMQSNLAPNPLNQPAANPLNNQNNNPMNVLAK